MHGVVTQGVTRRQADVLQFLVERDAAGVGSPTMREIATGIGHKSPAYAVVLIRALVERGFVHHVDRRARTIVLTDKTWALFRPQGLSHAA
jgi:SOS-response transcriptional repressor LexA